MAMAVKLFDMRRLSSGMAAALVGMDRVSFSLRLADVAERTGIERAAICRLENGTHENPNINTLNRCAEAIGRRISFRVVDVGG